MLINRRKLITGLIAFGCAPAIMRAESLMKVKSYFDPQKVLNTVIAQYEPLPYTICPIRLFYLDKNGFYTLSYEESDVYLRNLDDQA